MTRQKKKPQEDASLSGLATLYAMIFTGTLFLAFTISFLSNSELPYHASKYLNQIFPSVPVLTSFLKDYDHATYLATYECKHAYTVEIMTHKPLGMVLHGFLQPGEAEHLIETRLKVEDAVTDCIQQRVQKATKSDGRLNLVTWIKGEVAQPPHKQLNVLIYLNDGIVGGTMQVGQVTVSPGKNAAVVWMDDKPIGSLVEEGQLWAVSHTA
jgi:hypothetical protein